LVRKKSTRVSGFTPYRYAAGPLHRDALRVLLLSPPEERKWRRLGTRFGGHSPTIDVTSPLAQDWVLIKLSSFEMGSVPSTWSATRSREVNANA